MRVLAGTSGFSYKEWKGSFYPEDLPADEMLAYYAERLPAVEINNTFYRMPKPALLEGWATQVPEAFRFVLKASQRITHLKRLKEAGDEVGLLLRRRRDARRAARPRALPAAAEPEEGPAAPRGLPADAPRGPRAPRSSSATPPGSRTTSSRRCARAAPRSASPRTRTSRRPSSRRPTGATCACAARTTATRTWRRGPSACAPRRGTRPTSSSSTRTPGRDRGSRRSLPRACAPLTVDALGRRGR